MYIGGFIASCSVRFFPELKSSKEVSIERVERMDKEDMASRDTYWLLGEALATMRRHRYREKG